MNSTTNTATTNTATATTTATTEEPTMTTVITTVPAVTFEYDPPCLGLGDQVIVELPIVGTKTGTIDYDNDSCEHYIRLSNGHTVALFPDREYVGSLSPLTNWERLARLTVELAA